MTRQSKCYLIGGGIGNLAAAAFMIRDAAVSGENIVILEGAPIAGGSLDAGGNADTGYSMRGGRMLTTDNYECTWDLFKSIPSIVHPDKTVFEETLDFNEIHKSHSQARLVDRRRAKVSVESMGFTMADRLELLALSEASEEKLDGTRITDWLSPVFFDTEFWYMWATTFAFQPWHSAVEFKRYLHRFMLEFPRIETLGGVKRTVYNQYDSMVVPLQTWLKGQGVQFRFGCEVTDIDHRIENGKFTVTAIHATSNRVEQTIAVNDGDVVFLQNGSMTDASTMGGMHSAPEKTDKQTGKPAGKNWALWEKLAERQAGFGKPAVFNSSVAESNWQSFTVTLKDPAFFDKMLAFSGNEPGTGGLVTFKDSNWLMSIVLAHQPHFADQPGDVQVFWGYALFPDRIGDYVAKAMSDCSGEEILKELCGHLRFDAEVFSKAICIPCRMPYITSMFMARTLTDRPLPVPRESKNLAFVSQFVEIPDDVVFTVEYSVRAAQMAVYELFGVQRKVPQINRFDKSIKTQLEVLAKAFK
ncbi:MAG TPA: oleate hydratase [Burkholderiaceae bacterium]